MMMISTLYIILYYIVDDLHVNDYIVVHVMCIIYLRLLEETQQHVGM